MLLQGTQNDFLRLTQCLSQASRPQIRRIFILIESLARTTEQIKFLVRCRDSGVFPRTIEKLYLPPFMQASAVKRVKFVILRNAIRFLHRKKHEIKSTCGEEIEAVFTNQENCMAFRIAATCEKTYLRTERYHSERLEKKFNLIKGPETTPLPLPDRELFVTDLSGSRNMEETELLAKGPKFALKKQWNDQLRLEIQASFCKMAYQMRCRCQVV